MPPPPTPTPHVYPCLDWVPLGVSKEKPDRLKLSPEELKNVLAQAKSKALETRRSLGQALREESNQANDIDTNHDLPLSSAADKKNTATDEDDIIMREYGLDNYDDEDQHRGATDGANEMSEDEIEEDLPATGGSLPGLAEDLAALTYHASNDEDPYLRQGGVTDDDEDDEELIKPTDNLIVAGHVNRNESSLEVYVYDNEQNDLYLHHEIIQSDYPCCVKWIGWTKNQARNIAAVGYMNPDIFLWDLDVIDVLEPLVVLTGHEDAIIDLCWNSQVKNILASGSADSHVRLWDLDECKSISNIKLSGRVSALEFGLYEQFLLLAGDLSRGVSLIDTRSDKVTNRWKLGGEVEKVRWIPTDHSKFLVSDDLGYVYCFDSRQAKNDQPIVKFRAHQVSVTGLEFSPKCDDMLVTASADDAIKVWDTKVSFRGNEAANVEPTLVKEITDLEVGSILSLRMCPNTLGMIAVGGDSKCNSFKTYDLTKEKEVKERFINQRAA